MPSAVINSLNALNAPFHIISRAKIKEGKVYVYNGEFPPFSDKYTEIVPGIFVEERLMDILDAEYFNTTIAGKDIYAPLHLYGGYLPLTHPTKYKILDAGAPTPEDDGWDYKKVVFDTETTVGDLYKNACAYQYSADADAYLKLPAAGAKQNALKLYMQKRVMEIGGDAYDRIADMSRIILFLLTKVTLTAEETAILEPLLTHAQGVVELADVLNREKNIQDYVATVKANPEGYINGAI